MWRDLAQVSRRKTFQVRSKTFSGRVDGEDRVCAVFEAHTQEAMPTIPAGRLLVYAAAKGWESPCAFPGISAPAGGFAYTNATADFGAKRPAGNINAAIVPRPGSP